MIVKDNFYRVMVTPHNSIVNDAIFKLVQESSANDCVVKSQA